MKHNKVICIITAVLISTSIFAGCTNSGSTSASNNNQDPDNSLSSERSYPDGSSKDNADNSAVVSDESSDSSLISDDEKSGSSGNDVSSKPDENPKAEQSSKQEVSEKDEDNSEPSVQEVSKIDKPQTSSSITPAPTEKPMQQSRPNPSDSTRPEASKISLSTNSVTLKIGETKNLNTTVLPKNAADRSYSYYIDNASVIEYSNGILKGKNPGSATISFKTVNGVTSSCKVEVYGVPSSVKLNKTSIKLDEGDSYTLSAKTNIGNYGISYEWSSTNPDIVSVESTDYSTAVITAKTPGTAVVTAETANGVSSVCRITVNPIKNEQSDDYEQYEDEVIRLVNKERTARGLPKLKKRNDLVPLANTRAKEIVSKFDHVRPDGRNSFTILSDNNIQYSSVGENIAYGQDTPEYAMKCWMDSKGHRENILSTKFNGIGVGCYEHNGTLYWVQLFIHE